MLTLWPQSDPVSSVVYLHSHSAVTTQKTRLLTLQVWPSFFAQSQGCSYGCKSISSNSTCKLFGIRLTRPHWHREYSIDLPVRFLNLSMASDIRLYSDENRGVSFLYRTWKTNTHFRPFLPWSLHQKVLYVIEDGYDSRRYQVQANTNQHSYHIYKKRRQYSISVPVKVTRT